MNDKKILQEAIKKTGLLSQAKIAWVVHPILEGLAIKFAGYVGSHAVTQSGKPLLEQSIKEAFDNYKHANDASEDDNAVVRSFARCLLNHSIEVFSQQLVVDTPSGDLMWMPFVCGANEFVSKFPSDAKISCTWVQSRISYNIAIGFMMTKLLPPALLDNDSLAELLGETKVET
jgi:hypothetical protein